MTSSGDDPWLAEYERLSAEEELRQAQAPGRSRRRVGTILRVLGIFWIVLCALLGFVVLFGHVAIFRSPVRTLQSFMNVAARWEHEAVAALTCEAYKDKVITRMLGDPHKGKVVGRRWYGPAGAIKLDTSGLTFREMSNDGKTAVVHVAGSMKITVVVFGSIEKDRVTMDADRLLVKEGGVWKVCDLKWPVEPLSK